MNPSSSSTRPPSIRRLPPSVAEKIAAGEVIERPLSVVKELVENSLDAGSKRIEIRIYDGGRSKISVLDDGHGIAPEDLSLALEPHATSKISSIEDLDALHTLGFRGEALPSIAAVSLLTLETKVQNPHPSQRRWKQESSEILADDDLISLPLQGQPHGLYISVEKLFFNLPARYKFLKSISAEALALRELLERMALVNPEVEFQFYHDEKRLLNLKPRTSVEERLADIFETSPESIHQETAQYDQLRVTVFLDTFTRRKNSKEILLSVNHRTIRDKALQQSILTALRGGFMDHEYPRIYVDIQCPPDQVDVNVHPSKSEVRFSQPRDVGSLVYTAVKQALQPKSIQPITSAHQAPLIRKLEADSATTSILSHTESQHASLNTEKYIQEPTIEPTSHHPDSAFDFSSSRARSWNKQPLRKSSSTTNVAPSGAALRTLFDDLKNTQLSREYRFVGQVFHTYLLFENPEGLLVLDQHAAHERIQFEDLKKKYEACASKSTKLLVPEIIDLDPQLLLEWESCQNDLELLGFKAKQQKDLNRLELQALPTILKTSQAEPVLRDLLTQASQRRLGQESLMDSNRIDTIFATMACHASVRAGDTLYADEAYGLLETLRIENPLLHCPHGRPFSFVIQPSQFESLFKRKI